MRREKRFARGASGSARREPSAARRRENSLHGAWVFQGCKAASLRARESFTIGGRKRPLQHDSKSIQLLVLQRVAKFLVGGAES